MLSVGVYQAGLFLAATIGFHQVNNFFWFLKTYGSDAVMAAIFGGADTLITLPGFFMLAYFAFIIIVVLNSLSDVQKFLINLGRKLRQVFGFN